ncbi:MAG: hypothetical protein Q7T53_04100 [Deltaproteobacteria bacterium]|nr:hypothetical protein [Deltaproteobacteria bacterium]
MRTPEKALSVNGVPIRLGNERWRHIVENHIELAGHFYDVLETVESPEFVVKGHQDELIAVKRFDDGKYLLVVYKEVADNDGFIITAFFTSRIEQVKKRGILWKRD